MDDKVYIIQLFFKHNQSPSLTRRAFRNQKRKKCPYNDQQITRIVKNFERTGSISRKRESGQPPCSFQQSEAVVTTNAKLKGAHFYGMTSV